MAEMKMNDVVTRNITGCSKDRQYRLGCNQIDRWMNRHTRLPKCKGCGRLIDGEIKRGYCVWCQAMNVAAKLEIQATETKLRMERLAKARERERAKYAARRAAKKEVA